MGAQETFVLFLSNFDQQVDEISAFRNQVEGLPLSGE